MAEEVPSIIRLFGMQKRDNLLRYNIVSSTKSAIFADTRLALKIPLALLVRALW